MGTRNYLVLAAAVAAVFVVLAIGAILSTLALFISLRHAGHD